MIGTKILIADDDDDLRCLLAMRCRGLGLEVVTASDGLSALRLACDDPPDIVCMDVNMPGGNGLAACELLAEDPRFSQVPVIVLTGQSDRDIVRRCHGLGSYYVPKCADVWPRIAPILEKFLDDAENLCP